MAKKVQLGYWAYAVKLTPEEQAALDELGKPSTDDGKPLKSKAKVGTGYPRLSDSMGVHPKQRAEAAALDAKLGVPTEYSPGGKPLFRTRGHQKAWLKAHSKAGNCNIVNHDGGYGD